MVDIQTLEFSDGIVQLRRAGALPPKSFSRVTTSTRQIALSKRGNEGVDGPHSPGIVLTVAKKMGIAENAVQYARMEPSLEQTCSRLEVELLKTLKKAC
jgi:hypothetical protein